MPRYSVTIEATIAKTYDVDADDEDAAMDEASELFNCDPDIRDTYEQRVVQVEQHEDPKPNDIGQMIKMITDHMNETGVDYETALVNLNID
jgi:hypothetical protein